MAIKKGNITTLEQHLTKQYGKRGTVKRTEFEIKAKAFLIGEVIREERRLAKITQEQLADRIGAKKSFISRIENGQSDIQLSTLYRLLEFGLGKRLELNVFSSKHSMEAKEDKIIKSEVNEDNAPYATVGEVRKTKMLSKSKKINSKKKLSGQK